MNTERLLKMADFLDALQTKEVNLPNNVVLDMGWNFNHVFLEFSGGITDKFNHSCGTVGCAIGFLPNAFKTEFIPDTIFYSSPSTAYKQTKEFFDISAQQTVALFSPSDEVDELEGEDEEDQRELWLLPNILTGDSLPTHVAENIRKFVELKGVYIKEEE